MKDPEEDGYYYYYILNAERGTVDVLLKWEDMKTIFDANKGTIYNL